jgi:proline dehydrogenase
VKLTHFGLDISESTCRRNVTEVVIRAKERGTAVEVDMETSAHVDRTLSLVTNLHREYGCVRAVIQAYLRRSEQDIRMLNGIKVPIRLCKGAYQEPAAIAYPQKSEVDANYRHLAGLLLDSGYYPALATHDERIIREVVEIVRRRGASQANLEFQMLYGIRKSLQRELVRRGFSVRLYVPYGVAWYPYFMRRLAERPANLAFLVKNFLRR